MEGAVCERMSDSFRAASSAVWCVLQSMTVCFGRLQGGAACRFWVWLQCAPSPQTSPPFTNTMRLNVWAFLIFSNLIHKWKLFFIPFPCLQWWNFGCKARGVNCCTHMLMGKCGRDNKAELVYLMWIFYFILFYFFVNSDSIFSAFKSNTLALEFFCSLRKRSKSQPKGLKRHVPIKLKV